MIWSPAQQATEENTDDERVLNPLAMAREDSRQALRVRSYFMAASTSMLVLIVLMAWHLLGLLRTTPFVVIAAFVLGWLLVFYALFRTGLNRKAVDASLTVPQMSAASVTLLSAAFVADGGRAIFLVLQYHSREILRQRWSGRRPSRS